MAKNEYNLSDIVDIERLEQNLDLLAKIFEEKAFRKFIGEKCIKFLKEYSRSVLDNIKNDDIALNEIEKYKSAHQLEVGSDYIILFNDTMADLSHLSPETALNYPDGLSIAQLIEYGMGIYGSPQEDYETMVNPNRNYSKEWSYKREGIIHRSIGTYGRFIYEALIDYLDQYFEEWVDEYLTVKGVIE